MTPIKDFKLGKLPARRDPRNLKLAKYIDNLPAPPPTMDWVTPISSYGMLGNDSVGDCVEAAMGHMEQRWTHFAGAPFVPTTAQAIQTYSAITGYNPNDPSTDQGTDPTAALNYWRSVGFASHKIAAYVQVNPANQTEVMQAIQLFGGVFTGLALPLFAQNPVLGLNGNQCWSVQTSLTDPNGVPGSWGGHMIDIGCYGVDDKQNKGTMAVSWGELFDVTWGFLRAYSDEMFAIVTPDWIKKDGLSPSGLNTAALLSDLKLVTE